MSCPTEILTAAQAAMVRDNEPTLSDRAPGIDLPSLLNDYAAEVALLVDASTTTLAAHLDGGTSKHDATEVDVEGSLTYFPAGGLQAALAYADAILAASKPIRVGTIADPAADSVNGVHASNGDDVRPWVAPFASPAVPRNVTVTFGSAWAGGNVTVTGTDQFDAVLTEVIVASPANTVAGVKAFKTVTGITHASAGPGGLNHGASAGWGHKFGVVQHLAAAIGFLTADGANEAATWDATYNAFTPTTLPDGSVDYAWAVPV